LTCIINAEEGQDVTVIDIPNAFIQTHVGSDMAIIKICGIHMKLLVEIVPKVYKPFISTQ